MHWLSLSLLCAVSLASADALTKKKLSDYPARELVVVRFGVSALLLAPLVLLRPLPPLPTAFWGWLAALVPLELLAMGLYMAAIRDAPLAHTLPYLAFTPVMTTLTGVLVLGETVSPQGLAGILLVVAGAYLLNLESAGTAARQVRRRAWLEPLRAILRERGSRLMLAVAAIYSLTSVMGKAALQYMPPETFGPFYWCLLGLVSVSLFAFRCPRALAVIWRRPVWHLAVGVLMGVMIITHFLALARVEVAYMLSVKRTSLVFGILFGALFFGERDLRRHLLAGTLMCVGVAVILLS
jgi:drug/metabolite transporter (DMT)-like permease